MNNIKLEQINEISQKIFANSALIIDNKFGQDYARKNPNLLASVVSLQEKLYTQHNSKTA